MITYRLFRHPMSHFTSHVSTSVAYVVLFEDGTPIGPIWRQRWDDDADPDAEGRRLAWKLTGVSVLWPVNTRLAPMPGKYEDMPQCRMETVGYFGDNVVTLPDGRKFNLPLKTGGYLEYETGELRPAPSEALIG